MPPEPLHAQDTIVAVATAAGAGGVGIVRLSGPRALAIAQALGCAALVPRQAHYTRFGLPGGECLDEGIALYFQGPASFTGEDVVELQAHGSPVVLAELVAAACAQGARRAGPGEFSQRAFLNGKFDLAQAEALADLIAAADARAARAARRAMEGAFSHQVQALADQLADLRVHVEAAIDFADEPLDTLGGQALRRGLAQWQCALEALLARTDSGRRLRDGLRVVIVGPPNAGKSSLLNALVGRERAIVSDQAGTTRDVLTEPLQVGGIALDLVDTAGLREGGDVIEREGMRRAGAELERADLALVVLDARAPQPARAALEAATAGVPQRLWLLNKWDLLAPGQPLPVEPDTLALSVHSGAHLPVLLERLQALAGQAGVAEGEFTARARHVEALRLAQRHVRHSERELDHDRLELAAEELRLAHDALGSITGRVDADALLGRIFSAFCIGK